MEILDLKLEDTAEQLKALGHPVRLRIIQEIMDRETCNCTEVCCHFSQSQSTISQHLAILREAGFLEFEKVGNTSRFSLNHQAFDHLKQVMAVLANVNREPIDEHR